MSSAPVCGGGEGIVARDGHLAGVMPEVKIYAHRCDEARNQASFMPIMRLELGILMIFYFVELKLESSNMTSISAIILGNSTAPRLVLIPDGP